MALREYDAPKTTTRQRAVGIIRVSHVGKRKLKGAERFVSPREQQDKLSQWCAAQGIDLVAVYEELDVSGKTPLEKRPGLRPAIELVERGGAEIVIVAYFDRLVRSLHVQAQVLDRVERCGGKVVALDIGTVSNETAAQWLNATFHGMFAEYHSRITGEKTATAKRDAVARGVPPFSNLPPGYRRGETGSLVVVPEEAAAVVETFKLRAGGASLTTCRNYLREHGIERTYRGTQTMFENRLYLGEIHFGKLVNLGAHQAIVDRDLWQRACSRREPRGRPNKSDLLLARLGVLVCGSCGARLTSAQVWNRTAKRAAGGPRHRYAIYRCGMPGDCPSPVTISATLVEGVIVEEVRRRLVERTGSASLEQEIRDAATTADQAQKRLKNAIVLFTGDDMDDIEEAQKKLAGLRLAVRLTTERYEHLKGTSEPLTVLSATHDWDELTADGRRALIRAVLPRVEVLPASVGSDRLRF